MRITLKTFLFPLTLVPAYLHSQAGYTNVIEMVELGAGDNAPLLWYMPGSIAAEGNDFLVGAPVPEAGALFILSTVQTSPFEDWFLDQTAVGAYLPKAEIEVLTHDTESLVPQTRADRPFQVQVTVSGLYDNSDGLVLPDEVIQQAAKEVRLQGFGQSYPDGQISLPGGEVTTAAHTELSLEGNGDFPQVPGGLTFYTSLSPSAPDKARGEEHFVVRSLDDGGIQGTALAQKAVKVWPVWSAYQSGLTSPSVLPYDYTGAILDVPYVQDGELEPDDSFELADGEIGYDKTPPEVTFYWDDLYPSSTIAVIVNELDKPYPWGGIVMATETNNENGSYSDSLTITAQEWEDVLGGQGRYVVWMVTKTPGIGWEVGGNYINGELQGNGGGWIIPIQRDSISVRGSIHSLSE